MTLSGLVAQVLLLAVVYQSLCVSVEEGSPDENREGLIQEAVRSLLGVKDRSDQRGLPKKRLPPRYMLDLYDRYQTGLMASLGNTVRSILPTRGRIDGVDMFVFNLTGISFEEHILQSVLHVNKRQSRVRKRRLPLNYQFRVVDLSSDSDSQWIELSSGQKQGWSSYDVTDSVSKCRSVGNTSDYLLGVTALVEKPNGKKRPVFLKRVVRKNSKPFLIIFSEDKNIKSEARVDEDLTEGYVDQFLPDRLWKKGHLNNTPEVDDSRSTRIRRSVPLEIHHSGDPSIPDKKTESVRWSGSFSSNEVRYEAGDVSNSSESSHDDGLSEKYPRKTDPDIIPVPHTMKGKKKHPWRRKKNRRKNRKLPFWWMKHEENQVTHNSERSCQRKKLVVDFSKIGWSEWIIAPSTFNAYYCKGSCLFPSIKTGNPSNHATIQSLVHALSKADGVPAPCCIPSSTSSLTMLYVDENERVVLKNYPNMIVESCACR